MSDGEWLRGCESIEEAWCVQGMRCTNGLGVAKDLGQAAAFFRKAGPYTTHLFS